MASTPQLECPGGRTPIQGVPFDKSRGCVDTLQPLTGIACIDEGEVEPGYFCVRRLSDGQEFSGWSALRKPVLDERFWEACPADGSAPRPCFAVDCTLGAAPTTCTLEQSREQLFCGDDVHEWDENCCLRMDCTSDGDCNIGERCKETHSQSLQCGPGAPGHCTCGGPLNIGPSRLRCVADPAQGR